MKAEAARAPRAPSSEVARAADARGPRIEAVELTALQVPFHAAVREVMAQSEGGLGSMRAPLEDPS